MDGAGLGGEALLVGLLAEEHVDLIGALLDRGPNRPQTHEHPDAVAGPRRVEAALVDLVAAADAPGQLGGDRPLVDLEEPQAQPPPRERQRGEVPKALPGRPARDRRRGAVAKVVKAKEGGQVGVQRRRVVRLAQLKLVIARERLLEPASHPLAELLAARGDVGVPVEARGRDVEDLGAALLDRGHRPGQGRGERGGPASARRRRGGGRRSPPSRRRRSRETPRRPPPPRPRGWRRARTGRPWWRPRSGASAPRAATRRWPSASPRPSSRRPGERRRSEAGTRPGWPPTRHAPTRGSGTRCRNPAASPLHSSSIRSTLVDLGDQLDVHAGVRDQARDRDFDRAGGRVDGEQLAAPAPAGLPHRLRARRGRAAATRSPSPSAAGVLRLHQEPGLPVDDLIGHTADARRDHRLWPPPCTPAPRAGCPRSPTTGRPTSKRADHVERVEAKAGEDHRVLEAQLARRAPRAVRARCVDAALLAAGDHHARRPGRPAAARRPPGSARRRPSAAAASRPCPPPAGRVRFRARPGPRPGGGRGGGSGIPFGMNARLAGGIRSISIILRRSLSETATNASARRAISRRSISRRSGWPSNDQRVLVGDEDRHRDARREQRPPEVGADLVGVQDVDPAPAHLAEQSAPQAAGRGARRARAR